MVHYPRTYQALDGKIFDLQHARMADLSFQQDGYEDDELYFREFVQRLIHEISIPKLFQQDLTTTRHNIARHCTIGQNAERK